MNRPSSSLSVLALLALVSGAAAAAAPAADAPAMAAPGAVPAGAAPTAAAAFDRIKGLAGRWSAETPNVEGGKLMVSWRVTAAGNAVMETLFEGQPHEMISMYFLDGDELRMTHYCSAGNQPRMRYDAERSTGDELAFSFDGGTGFNPKKDFHIHEGRIQFRPDGVRELWAGWGEGRQVDVKEFRLVSRE